MIREPSQRIGSYAFITAEQHVLLSLLNRGPNRGKWTLVGGKIEWGETPKQALLREIEEEAGLELDVNPVLIDVFSHQVDQMHLIGIIHRIELPKIVECRSDGDGLSSDGTKWFLISELNQAELNPSVLKVLHLLNYIR